MTTPNCLHSLNEVDFGYWWTWDGDERSYPRWRVSWVESTGELCAIQLGKLETRLRLGKYESRDAVESALDGWADPPNPIYHNLKALVVKIRYL